MKNIKPGWQSFGPLATISGPSRETVTLKRQSNEIFSLQFFSLLDSFSATDQRVKIFPILVKISVLFDF